MKGLSVNLKKSFTAIDANLDDLQAGVEACNRAAGAICHDAENAGKLLKDLPDTRLFSSLLRRAGELNATASDQLGALQDLREGIARLKQELKRLTNAVKPTPFASAADR